MAVVFNGISRLIEVTDPADLALDVEDDIYSRWKDWMLIDDNSKYAVAMRTFGGDETIEGQLAPKYFFLQNYWRVQINNGEIVSIGLNLYSDDFPSPYLVEPGSGVSDRNSDAVSVNSADIQYSSFEGGVTVDFINGFPGTTETAGGAQIGTPRAPSNNIPDAVTICIERGLPKTMFILGNYTFDTGDDVTGFTIIGENKIKSIFTFNPGAIALDIEVTEATITGTVDGFLSAKNCDLLTLSDIGSDDSDTIFENCIILADDGATPALKLKTGLTTPKNIHFIDCVSGNPGEYTSTLDYNNSNSPVAFRRMGGGINVSNMTQGQDNTFEFNQGQIILDSSNTYGTVRLGGFYKLIDQSNLTIEHRNQSIKTAIEGEDVDPQNNYTSIESSFRRMYKHSNLYYKVIMNDSLKSTLESELGITGLVELQMLGYIVTIEIDNSYVGGAFYIYGSTTP